MKSTAENLVENWRVQTINTLCEGYQELLDHAGDVLVDFAAKSESMTIQTEFFDAQRELYLKGLSTLQYFRRNLDQLSPRNEAESPLQPGGDTLSLLDKDDYELSVALGTIADNCAIRNQQSLHAFRQRLSVIRGGRRVNLEHTPLNPRQVTEAFDRGIADLDIDKRVRLVLFTLFDRYVVAIIDGALENINRRLAEAGILPTIRYDVPRGGKSPAPASQQSRPETDPADPASPTPPARAGSSPVGGVSSQQDLSAGGAATTLPSTVYTPPLHGGPPSTEESLRAISQLLAKRRKQAHSQPVQPATPQQREASRRQLKQALEIPSMQEKASAALLTAQGDKMVVDKQLMLRVREVLRRQRALIRSLASRKQLASSEQDVIEIVGMLFEAILDDDNIPITVKTLLSHLHTPYLKIAADDPGFLRGKNHPARELLDEMLRLGVRWVDDSKPGQGLFPVLRECVREVIEKPLSTDFGALRGQLDLRAQQLGKHREVTEKRTLEKEKGQALLAQSRETAHSAVQTLLAEHRQPAEVRTFMQTVFTDYLSLLLLRNEMNPRHPVCKQALNEAVELIDKISEGDLQAGTNAAIALRGLIRDLLPHYENHVDQFIRQLEGPLKFDEPPPAVVETAADAPPEQGRDEEKVMGMAPGSLLRWLPQGQEESLQIKLIWTNPHTRSMLFVNQEGIKVAQMKAREVADALKNGTLEPLDKAARGGLLDGLLDNIRKRLQTPGEQAAQ